MTLQLLTATPDPLWQAFADATGHAAHFAPGDSRSGTLLTLAQWREHRESWPALRATAVVLPNTADVAGIAADLPRWQLVLLEFPKWTDGRAYSQARLLRTRHGWRGELRATGEVVADMAPLLARAGFSSAVLRAGERVEHAQRALGYFAAYYQADPLQPQPLFGRQAA